MDILKIDPWIDPTPSNADTMTLNKLRKQIKKKKPWAYRQIALRYEVGGPGLKRSEKKTFEYLEKGMKLGDPMCMNEIGDFYEQSSEVNKSPQLAKKAFKHYQKAALKGYDQAQCNLGNCYSNGVGVVQSNSKAREWYNRAAAQDNEEAIENLRLLDKQEKEKAKAKAEKKEPGEKKAEKQEPNKTKVPKESESRTSTKFGDNQEIEIKDTKDLKIVPWVDSAPKNVLTMTLNRLRQKVKKKKVWAS